MKIASQFIVAALVLSVMSCSDSGKKGDATTTTEPAETIPQTGSPNQAVTPPAGNVALNPAHGQPNHRCDIEVGAPLDSPPKPNLSAPQPTFNPSAISQPQSVAPGTNPPHGQPGHDCGIPVGAPLTKK